MVFLQFQVLLYDTYLYCNMLLFKRINHFYDEIFKKV